MKALEILMNDLGDTTKNHILLWGNLYKGSGFRSLIPSVDDLFDLILVTEEFNEVLKSEIDGRLKYSKSTPDFTRRIKQLKKINKQRLAKCTTLLQEVVDNIALTEKRKSIYRTECQAPITALRLFNRMKENDPKKYESVSGEEVEKTKLVDMNSGHTECRLFDLSPILPLVCEGKYYIVLIERFKEEKLNRLDAKPSEGRIPMKSLAKAIREIINNAGDRVWTNKELFDVIDENYSRPNHWLENKKFRKAFNKAFSNEAKVNPELLAIDKDYAYRGKK